MAQRPVFVPRFDSERLVREVYVDFTWHPGMAPSQKKKNIRALHERAATKGLAPLLEISTKSDDELGQQLSAFNLKVKFSDLELSIESAYQGSKVFERGGPYTYLHELSPLEAKREPRLHTSGALIGFEFDKIKFPLKPKTVFYDWLYLHALYQKRDFYWDHLSRFSGFTDIEFNPDRSINCQARTCATFISLESQQLLDDTMNSFDLFEHLLAIDEKDRELERRASIGTVLSSRHAS